MFGACKVWFRTSSLKLGLGSGLEDLGGSGFKVWDGADILESFRLLCLRLRDLYEEITRRNPTRVGFRV